MIFKQGKIWKVDGKKIREADSDKWSVNINVENVKAEGNNLVISYVYKIAYEPGVGELTVSGEMTFEDQSAKQLADKWKKKEPISNEFMEEILNAVSYTGSTIGTLLAFALNIPAPINLPKASVQRQEQKAS